MSIKTRCPYCGHMNKIDLEIISHKGGKGYPCGGCISVFDVQIHTVLAGLAERIESLSTLAGYKED